MDTEDIGYKVYLAKRQAAIAARLQAEMLWKKYSGEQVTAGDGFRQMKIETYAKPVT